jgi:hypothetical protein
VAGDPAENQHHDTRTKCYLDAVLLYDQRQQERSWIAPASDLERAGMVVAALDDRWFGEESAAAKADNGYPVHLREIYPVGENVARMCFDDPKVPAFRTFAR